MSRVTVLQPDVEVPIALLGEALESHGVTLDVAPLHAGAPVPDVDALGNGLIVLGAAHSVEDTEIAPWIPQALELIRQAIAAEIPTLGICLGAQLIGAATGGQVTVGAPAGLEAGVVTINWQAAAVNDPVLGALWSAGVLVTAESPENGPCEHMAAKHGATSPAIAMHNDAVTTLPPTSRWLGYSDKYPHQAFRVGSALALQFHPEWGADLGRFWMAKHPELDQHAFNVALEQSEAALTSLTTNIAKGFVAQIAAVSQN